MTEACGGSGSRTVLVTGGSLGIGRGIASVFAKNGYNVAISARNAESGKAAETSLREETGNPKVVFVQGDVTSGESMKGVVAKVVEEFGGLDVLCANAGMFPSAKLEEMSEKQWDQMFDVNVKGTMHSVKACMGELKKSSAGRIVITSSITGPITGYPGWTHYGATKAAQLGFMRTAALEFAREKITVNAILPGNIFTEGLQDMGEAYLSSMKGSIPLKRLGEVEDIGNAALFFAQPSSSFITGQALVVDGGQTLPETQECIDL
uniref:3-oxoacyl-[acyl-carrier-protein] reductase n=1 Tax=Chromera velia CCMP2878 TaxID=1169474 RepID=A0A0G4I185_9ALVE|eukprot:Cvel_10085.t1-p1 / transcript=Cvel_10085.t1 / gene=Cvel_10085 / organism=Chromera_velia_CCMP2878 / gene_product=3-oxoacyl-[acyl-carrier-protein] reductase FabG, putative / transcript_product=3-oxoacyl-[acyl-carrier-protein] reductase FabG, putative / location=Cvel_scaffold600:59291-60079(-) / protein_length=263 / sequence_SO=supercontig / SO=protein_coding / is_pseudo=false